MVVRTYKWTTNLPEKSLVMDNSGEKEGALAELMTNSDHTSNSSLLVITGDDNATSSDRYGDHQTNNEHSRHGPTPGSDIHVQPDDCDSHEQEANYQFSEHVKDMSGIEVCLDDSGSQTETCGSCHSLTLTDMPVEILLHIASFLQPKVIVTSLYPVCKTFYNIFSHDHYWKTRISGRWPQKYPVLDSKYDFLLLAYLYNSL